MRISDWSSDVCSSDLNEMKCFSGDGDADLQGACHAGCGWERPQPRGRGSCCQNATWCRFRTRKRAVPQMKCRRRHYRSAVPFRCEKSMSCRRLAACFRRMLASPAAFQGQRQGQLAMAVDEAASPLITYDDFARLDVRVGTIVDAQPFPEARRDRKSTRLNSS